jgi:hypothetical protein
MTALAFADPAEPFALRLQHPQPLA